MRLRRHQGILQRSLALKRALHHLTGSDFVATFSEECGFCPWASAGRKLKSKSVSQMKG